MVSPKNKAVVQKGFTCFTIHLYMIAHAHLTYANTHAYTITYIDRRATPDPASKSFLTVNPTWMLPALFEVCDNGGFHPSGQEGHQW